MQSRSQPEEAGERMEVQSCFSHLAVSPGPKDTVQDALCGPVFLTLRPQDLRSRSHGSK